MRYHISIFLFLSAVQYAYTFTVQLLLMLGNRKRIPFLALGRYVPLANVETFVWLTLVHHIALLV